MCFCVCVFSEKKKKSLEVVKRWRNFLILLILIILIEEAPEAAEAAEAAAEEV